MVGWFRVRRVAIFLKSVQITSIKRRTAVSALGSLSFFASKTHGFRHIFILPKNAIFDFLHRLPSTFATFLRRGQGQQQKNLRMYEAVLTLLHFWANRAIHGHGFALGSVAYHFWTNRLIHVAIFENHFFDLKNIAQYQAVWSLLNLGRSRKLFDSKTQGFWDRCRSGYMPVGHFGSGGAQV